MKAVREGDKCRNGGCPGHYEWSIVPLNYPPRGIIRKALSCTTCWDEPAEQKSKEVKTA